MQSLEAARTGRYDKRIVQLVQLSGPLPCFSPESTVPHPPQFAHAARLVLSQDRKIDAGLLQQTRSLDGDRLQGRVEARHAAREIDDGSLVLLPYRHGCLQQTRLPGG